MTLSFTRSMLVALTVATGALGAMAVPAAADDARVIWRDSHVRHDAPMRIDAAMRDRGCALRQALRKAERFGLHRAHVVRDSRRAVVVDGRKRGQFTTIRFAQAPGCPVLSVR